MQEKVVFDTGVYIGVFNRGLHREEVDGLGKVMYLAHPVLHELWMGARGHAEVRHLDRFTSAFIRLKRLIMPSPSSLLRIGRVCRSLRAAGRIDPRQPRLYNDVCIAVLARQVGATVVTTNPTDFERIARFVDFRFRSVR